MIDIYFVMYIYHQGVNLMIGWTTVSVSFSVLVSNSSRTIDINNYDKKSMYINIVHSANQYFNYKRQFLHLL